MRKAGDLMTLILQAWDELVETLTDAGLTVVDDPRNLRPGTVMVDPPNIRGRSQSVVELDFPVTVVAAPPANRDAYRYLVDLADLPFQRFEDEVLSGGEFVALNELGDLLLFFFGERDAGSGQRRDSL